MDLNSLSSEQMLLGLGLIGVLVLLITGAALVRYIISAIGFSKMFGKAGEAGWKAFVPVLNDFVRFRMVWQTKIFWIYFGAMVLSTVFGGGTGILSVLGGICGIALIVLAVMLNIRIAKAFGRGAGTGVLLVLFPGIMSLILGFGKAEYTPACAAADTGAAGSGTEEQTGGAQ